METNSDRITQMAKAYGYLQLGRILESGDRDLEVYEMSMLKNPVLVDVLIYRQERALMTNPKGWEFVYNTLMAPGADLHFKAKAGATNEQWEQALAVLAVLAMWEKVGSLGRSAAAKIEQEVKYRLRTMASYAATRGRFREEISKEFMDKEINEFVQRMLAIFQEYTNGN